ncbi:hypothetical protein [Lapidilactobacillus bayanensis]|uniref:hypothetical protein n=1 Tax=Lapidilactobacillus bayanensis TaxID=2485998 RepID=UPI000F7A53C6|nr:hypothetical protein [Lapidilactobacillus bayanensis]
MAGDFVNSSTDKVICSEEAMKVYMYDDFEKNIRLFYDISKKEYALYNIPLKDTLTLKLIFYVAPFLPGIVIALNGSDQEVNLSEYITGVQFLELALITTIVFSIYWWTLMTVSFLRGHKIKKINSDQEEVDKLMGETIKYYANLHGNRNQDNYERIHEYIKFYKRLCIGTVIFGFLFAYFLVYKSNTDMLKIIIGLLAALVTTSVPISLLVYALQKSKIMYEWLEKENE